ncbi:MAG: hypothetical protein KAR20_10860, partial [Candidatus Heimdallarchaeota archaeon]|nr:hypothetical protein [Candidatus Heimdallarchaeota archaeon]
EYKVESIDQDDEPNSFRTLVGKPIIIKTKKGKVSVKKAPASNYDNAGPLYTGQGAEAKSITVSSSRKGKSTVKKQSRKDHPSHRFPVDSIELPIEQTQPPVDLTNILDNLKALDVPDGYLREVILIGRDLYSIIERRRRFFGKDTTERDIEKIAQPPEGTFFATDYTPRIVITNGEVIAIEFLKATASAEALKPKEIKGAAAHLSELVGFFQKIGKKPEMDEIAGSEYNF